MMRHKSRQTTDGYINLRERLAGVDMVSQLNLPAGLENPELLDDDTGATEISCDVAPVLRGRRDLV